MEAAALLPAFLLLVLLGVQPACLLYTRAVMESAAAETARLMVTAEAEGDDAYRAFALRRLAAVPDVSIFHVGGPLSWKVELSRAGEGGAVGVSIEGAARPLPILGALAPAMGALDANGDVGLRVEVSYDGRPGWLEGGYDAWTSIWE